MCAIIKNPLQRDGTSQQDRLLKALLPQNAKIDDRKIEDILAFATEYSKLINFYDTENKPDGNWGCFYENDTCILLALLATIDTASIETAFKNCEEKINTFLKNDNCGDEADTTNPLPGYYDEMINIIFSLALRIQQSCKRLPDGHLLKEEIITIIKNDLHLAIIDNKQQDALIKLIGYDKGSIAPLNDYKSFIQTPKNNFCACTKAWQLNAEGYDCIYPDNSFTAESLKKLFYIFFIALLKIKQQAKNYFETCLQTKDDHEPHVTLFLTFLYLFQYAIDHLNTLTSQHLLYYYQNVLCLHKQQQTADKVHIVFELAKNFHTHLVEEGALLNAGKDDTGKPLAYALVEEVVVNKAQVAEVKTVYINEATGVLHAAENANTKDGIAEAFNKDEEPSWKPLGSSGSPADEVGFAIASPMFFLKEGIRAGMISCKLDGNMNGIDENTFRLLYSSGEEWVEMEHIDRILNRLIKNHISGLVLLPELADRVLAIIDLGFKLIKEMYDALYDEKKTGSFTLDNAEDFIAKSQFGKKIKDIQADIETKIKKLKKEDKNAEQKLTALLTDIITLKNGYLCRMGNNNELDFFFVANTTSPAFAPIIKNEKQPDIQSQWPVVKILIKNTDGTIVSRYNDFKAIKISKIDIKVAAYGLKDIVVQNDTSILDNSKEIQPFTQRPYVGSYFYLGSKEIFQKKLDLLGVQMEWADKPDFATHYVNYGQQKITESQITVNADVLSGSNFYEVYKGRRSPLFSNGTSPSSTILLGLGKPEVKNGNDDNGDIFRTVKKNAPKAAAIKATLAEAPYGLTLNALGRDPFLPDFEEYNTNSKRGFLRLDLQHSFLHTQYPMVYAEVVAREGKSLTAAMLPQEPYTPKLKNTSLFYVSTERTEFGASNYNATIEEFYHITPFGYQKMDIDKQTEVYLLPQFNTAAANIFTQGNLYIGLKDALPEQKVNILFQVISGTGDNRFAPPNVEWSYLINNTWVPFKPFEIQDHTRADESSQKSLLQSGIIEFSLPKAISSTGTTILNDDYLWLRAVAHEDELNTTDSDAMLGLQRIAALPDLAVVIAQAGIAQFENNNNSLNHLAAPLPAETIAKFTDSRAAIKKVAQPYYSFYGKMPENDNEFYRRISERLRHKNRAICIWDYERLVLQQFPQLHKVKCLNHTGIAPNLMEATSTIVNRLREITPCYVTVSVIPDLRNKNAVNKLEPRVPVGLLDEIKLYLKKQTNLFVAAVNIDKPDYLQVLNPLYEQLKVKTCVRFYEGLDVAYYKYLLNEDLKKFLSPWAFDANTEINFGAVYHKSAILNFIEERKYVDVVLGFAVEHYKDSVKQPDYDADHIIPTTSRSVLTSYNNIDTGQEYEHKIEYMPYIEGQPCGTCSATA